MANKSKSKGVRQETAICKIINDYAGADIARREVQHGSEDQGDLNIRIGSLTLIGESKHYSTYPSEGLIEDFKEQTVTENLNAGGDGGLLFINLPRRGNMRMEVWLQRSTHLKLELQRVGIDPSDMSRDESGHLGMLMEDDDHCWRRLTMLDFLHEYLDRG